MVIEFIFNYPGIGYTMFNAVLQRDYPMIQGLVIVFAAIFVLINIMVDLSYTYLDPRIREFA